MKRFAYAVAMLLLAGCSAQTGRPPSTVPVPAKTELVVLAAQPATITYGSTVYTFSVPAQDEQGNSNVTAGDVPGGIIWLTPPGFPDAAAHPMRAWSLWFTPASTTGGSLWTGAQLWQTFPNEQAPRLVGVTGGYAIISLMDGTQIQIVGVGLVDGRTVNIARYAPPVVAGYGHGVYAWQDPNRQLHVVKPATGEEQVIALPALSRIDIVGGGILVDGQVVKSPLVDKPTSASVPAGYKWIGPDQAKPEIAVPVAWIVGPIPGGSSAGVSATNPQDPNEKVIMWDSYCAGCQDPGITSPHHYASWSSPLVDVAQGETYTWLDDHTVAFTLPPDDQNPYPTYGVNRTFVERPGNQVAKVSMPANDRHTATIILNSMLSRP